MLRAGMGEPFGKFPGKAGIDKQIVNRNILNLMDENSDLRHLGLRTKPRFCDSWMQVQTAPLTHQFARVAAGDAKDHPAIGLFGIIAAAP